MSTLPAYQPVPKYDERERDSPAPPSPSGLAYPPESSARKHRTTYIFSHKGVDEKAVGLMGKNKQETIDIVREAFPNLQDHPHEFIEFYIDDAKILASAWPDFAAEPPETLTIYLSDGDRSGARSQEVEWRRRRGARGAGLFFGIWIALLVMAIMIIWLCGGFEKSGVKTSVPNVQ